MGFIFSVFLTFVFTLERWRGVQVLFFHFLLFLLLFGIFWLLLFTFEGGRGVWVLFFHFCLLFFLILKGGG